ncbi:YbjQ family protein [Massilia sp. GCM10020059]|uniref:YbjQ family protein n=1 Tax=Massilia agrisoli TaxID=2892444 RepID=A0ABS8INX1_9BURK|nr:heavy metal-binding domain-containing protein [Massilia agrisoli]MCC6070194.1 YbjQ family protein [Massilia agrisoli]
MIELAITLSFWLIPIVLGYVFGRAAEAKHFRSIVAREQSAVHLPTTSSKAPLADAPIERSELVHGSVVISIDYFKRALAALHTIIGGPVKSHESLLDRARREAVLRMKESCPGAHEIINLRLETCTLANNVAGDIGSVEVLAYGTAVYFARP